MGTEVEEKKKKQDKHYVNNDVFSTAVRDYVEECNKCREKDQPVPVVPDYIAECFLKIGRKLANRDNFNRYTYREEMVMDAVENCLKAINNYKIDTPTRTGKPNAFGYFTQISWWAFLRRIEKESLQHDIKLEMLSKNLIEEFVVPNEDDQETARAIQSFVDDLRRRIDDVKEKDNSVKEYKKETIKRRRKSLDSDISDFYEE